MRNPGLLTPPRYFSEALEFGLGLTNHVVGFAIWTLATYGAIIAGTVHHMPEVSGEQLAAGTPMVLRWSVTISLFLFGAMLGFLQRSPFGRILPNRWAVVAWNWYDTTMPQVRARFASRFRRR